MTNSQKAEYISKDAYMPDTGFNREDLYDAAMDMAQWKDEQLKRQKQKLKEFENWLYNKQSDFKYEGMREELVGLNAAIQKFEELGL